MTLKIRFSLLADLNIPWILFGLHTLFISRCLTINISFFVLFAYLIVVSAVIVLRTTRT